MTATPVCRELSVLSLEKQAAPDMEGGVLHTLRLSAPGWERWSPGQFVMLRLKERGSELTWARPFSICQANDKELTLFFQVAGRGTTLLSAVRPGETVDVWGPLGNSFAVDAQGPTLLLAGGIGIAPFVGYIARHPAPNCLSMDFGHRLPLSCYPFAACGSAIAARNHHECVPADLQEFVSTIDLGISAIAAQNGLVLACGPLPFLRTVRSLALMHGARAQLSLETRMACGVGACLGCVVKGKVTAHTVKGEGGQLPDAPFSWVQTCTCGPVFWADEVELED